MYIESRTWSAPQSPARASSEALLTHCGYHWRPWVLMPRNWIGRPYWLQSLTPQTRSWPLAATGVPPAGGGVVTPSTTVSRSRLGPPPAVVAVARTVLLPARGVAVTVASCQVDQAPVPGNASAALTSAPLTVIRIGRLTAVPLAKRKRRV